MSKHVSCWCTKIVSSHWDSCGHTAVLQTTAGQMFTTSGGPDAQACPRRMTMFVVQIKQHKCIKRITRQLDVSLARVHNTVCSLCVKDLTHDHKARRVGLSRHASHMLRRSRSFCSASMQETKHALDTRYPKPEKHPWYGNTHHLPHKRYI